MYRRELLGLTRREIQKFISSIIDDKEIVIETIDTMIVHVIELFKSGILRKEIACKILKELIQLLKNPEVLINEQIEDIHESLENYLIERLGIEIGGWIGIGRSRNDHVVTAHKLKLRKCIIELLNKLFKIRQTLLNLMKKYSNTYFIVFTHAQPAQISLFSHYLHSIDEMLSTYMKLMYYILNEIVNKSSLGSGPSVGTLVNIDRLHEASLLKFNDIVYNTLYAIETRNYFSITCSIVMNLVVELNRFINDLIMYSQPSINYVRIPDEHCSTSSIMPHKRNPVTLEIIRSRFNRVIGYVFSIMNILTCIGKSYYLDLQELTPIVWGIFKDVLECLEILNDLLSKIELNEEKILEDCKKYPITSAETVEYNSITLSKSFRECYFELARAIKKGNVKLLIPDEVLKLRKSIGSASFENIKKLIEYSENDLKYWENELGKLNTLLNLEKELIDIVQNICKEN